MSIGLSSPFLKAVIKMKPDGEFLFFNEGKRPVFIDGKPVLNGSKAKIRHSSVVEVSNEIV